MKIPRYLLFTGIGFMSLCTLLASCKKNETATKNEMTENDIRLLNPEEQKIIAGDFNFLIDYYLYDVESFKIAKEKTQSKDFKKFAEDEIVSGEKMIQNIKTYASQYNYTLDTVVTTKKNNSLYQLTNSDVANFDKIFINTYIDANNAFTDSINNKIEVTNRADLKDLLNNVKNENVQRIGQLYKLRDQMR